MSKRKRGVSLQEKRERVLKIYHDSKDVFNLKEVEKLGSKAGVGSCCRLFTIYSSVRALRAASNGDVNQALVDDALVDCDKTERVEKLRHLTEQRAKVEALRSKVQHLAENDPEILDQLERKVRVAKEGADRWTDNVFTLKSWVVQKRGVAGSEVSYWLGIKDDFDYVA
ncbi:hypothetical protein BBJ28_00004691 [Nothophytophthora sp. Chile5]|nr:hypothetical protein BBJ28_00004691 [Nothophytophthora sp. Chile5]